MRKCRKCGERKPLSYFYRRRRTNGGTYPRSECKVCKDLINKKWVTANCAKSNLIKNTSRKRIRTLKRAFINWLKGSVGCVDCGYNNPIALDFDHVNGSKLFGISTGKDSSVLVLQKEMQKCVVRCANCHRLATYNRSH